MGPFKLLPLRSILVIGLTLFAPPLSATLDYNTSFLGLYWDAYPIQFKLDQSIATLAVIHTQLLFLQVNKIYRTTHKTVGFCYGQVILHASTKLVRQRLNVQVLGSNGVTEMCYQLTTTSMKKHIRILTQSQDYVAEQQNFVSRVLRI